MSLDVDGCGDCGIYRSLRHGATTRAKIADVRETDIDLANKWREVESAKGSDINEECMQV